MEDTRALPYLREAGGLPAAKSSRRAPVNNEAPHRHPALLRSSESWISSVHISRSNTQH